MTPADERPLRALFSELAQETGHLVEQEVALARVEMTEKLTTAVKHGYQVAWGAAFLLFAVLSLGTALVAGLTVFVPLWLSALAAGAVTLALGYWLANRGIKGLHEVDPTPRDTLLTLKESRLWLRNQMNR